MPNVGGRFYANIDGKRAIKVELVQRDLFATPPALAGRFLGDFLIEEQADSLFLDALIERLRFRCRACNGRGWTGNRPTDDNARDCPTCGGSGDERV